MTPVTRRGDFFSFMANQQQDPVQNALLDYMLKQQQNPGLATNQAFQRLMSNPTISSRVNDTQNFYNAANNDLYNTVKSQAQNGVDGYAVNPVPGMSAIASQ